MSEEPLPASPSPQRGETQKRSLSEASETFDDAAGNITQSNTVSTDTPAKAKRRRTRSMDNNDDETNIREKSVALIKKSLGDDEKAGDVATAIEKAVYDEIEDANDHRYRSRIRSRVSNIMHNIALKEQLLAGTITPPKFAKMTADELASPKLKEWRGKLKVEALEEHMLPEKEVVGLDNTRKIKETID